MNMALIAAATAAAAGGTAQAITGFGFALVAVPLLALAVSPRDAITTVTATSAVLTASAALRHRDLVDRRLTARCTIAAVAAMPVGLIALILLPQRVLTFGVVAVAVAFLTLSSIGWQPRPGGRQATMAGLISGASLTATGMNGPPLVAMLHAFRLPRRQQRATLQAVFTIQDMVAVAAFAVLGQMPGRVWLLTLAAVPAAELGWLGGDRIFRMLDERATRRMVSLLLVATAATLVVRTALA
jgi:uncharacterized protein